MLLADAGAGDRLEMTPAAAKISECLVRAATPADMAAVTTIYAHFVETSTATFDLVAPGQATMQRRLQLVLDHGLPSLLPSSKAMLWDLLCVALPPARRISLYG